MTSTVVEDENQDDARDKAARLVEANEKLAEAMVALATIIREAVELIRGQQDAAAPTPPASGAAVPLPNDASAARPVAPDSVQLAAPAPDESLELPSITIGAQPSPTQEEPQVAPAPAAQPAAAYAAWLPPDWLGRSMQDEPVASNPPPAPPAFDIDTYVPPAPSDPDSPFNRFRAQLHGPLQVPVMGEDESLRMDPPVSPPPRQRESAAPAVPDPAHSDTNVRDAPPFIAASMGNSEPQYDVLQSLRGFTDQVRSQARVTAPLFEDVMSELAQYNSRLEALEMSFLQERSGGAY